MYYFICNWGHLSMTFYPLLMLLLHETNVQHHKFCRYFQLIFQWEKVSTSSQHEQVNNFLTVLKNQDPFMKPSLFPFSEL